MARWLFLCACLFGLVSFGYHQEVSRAPDARPLGSICESTHECRKGTSCIQYESVLQGQCAAPCNADSICVNAFGSSALCLGADLCARACRTSADCPADTYCNGYAWCERQRSESESESE